MTTSGRCVLAKTQAKQIQAFIHECDSIVSECILANLLQGDEDLDSTDPHCVVAAGVWCLLRNEMRGLKPTEWEKVTRAFGELRPRLARAWKDVPEVVDLDAKRKARRRGKS